MKCFIVAVIIISILSRQYYEVDAFQPGCSRRALLQKTKDGIIATSLVGVAVPEVASAKQPAKQKKELLRGGKGKSDALHNGTDLNKNESAVASGLLDKLGVPDITPDNGPSARAAPTK